MLPLAVLLGLFLPGCIGAASGELVVAIEGSPHPDFASLVVTLVEVRVVPSGGHADNGLPIDDSAREVDLSNHSLVEAARSPAPVRNFVGLVLGLSGAHGVRHDGSKAALRAEPSTVSVPIQFNVTEGNTTRILLQLNGAASVRDGTEPVFSAVLGNITVREHGSAPTSGPNR